MSGLVFQWWAAELQGHHVGASPCHARLVLGDGKTLSRRAHCGKLLKWTYRKPVMETGVPDRYCQKCQDAEKRGEVS